MAYEEPFQLPPEFGEQPLTARVLEDYALCPRKFLLSFFVSRDDEQRFRGGAAALHDAVRQALVECHDRGGPAAGDVAVLLDSFEAHWRGELCADSIEEEQLHEQGLQMLRDYHEDRRDASVMLRPPPASLSLTHRGQAFAARSDVVLRGDDGARVVCFVTGRRALNEEQLRGDLGAGLLWLVAQANDLAGDGRPARVEYYALRKRAGVEVALTADEAEALRQDLASRAARLRRESEFAPIKGTYCRWCRVRNRCPLWRR